MSRVAIIAAMPGELKPLVRGWAHTHHDGVDLWRRKSEQGEWLAACAGMGADRATRAFAATEQDGPLDLVLSAGWVGALTAAVSAGEVTDVSGVIDVRTGERFRTGQFQEGQSSVERWLVTVPHVAGREEKQRLAATYGADLVDMEAASVARLAAMRGIPFYAIRGVSDGVDDLLPDFNAFRGPLEEFRLASFVIYAALRPKYWPSLVRMGDNSRKAAEGMACAISGFLDERGSLLRRNGYPGIDPA
jgi:adenosylhomocysteine nucleosidase